MENTWKPYIRKALDKLRRVHPKPDGVAEAEDILVRCLSGEDSKDWAIVASSARSNLSSRSPLSMLTPGRKR